jgi:hypothetical protein
MLLMVAVVIVDFLGIFLHRHRKQMLEDDRKGKENNAWSVVFES